MIMNHLDINTLDWQKMNGLLPAVIQHAENGNVLMLGYMNREALAKTIETGFVWFYSRTRERLWMKGEESGNFQQVKKVMVDCDSDAQVYLVEPAGPACHTGNRTCFHNELK